MKAYGVRVLRSGQDGGDTAGGTGSNEGELLPETLWDRGIGVGLGGERGDGGTSPLYLQVSSVLVLFGAREPALLRWAVGLLGFLGAAKPSSLVRTETLVQHRAFSLVRTHWWPIISFHTYRTTILTRPQVKVQPFRTD